MEAPHRDGHSGLGADVLPEDGWLVAAGNEDRPAHDLGLVGGEHLHLGHVGFLSGEHGAWCEERGAEREGQGAWSSDRGVSSMKHAGIKVCLALAGKDDEGHTICDGTFLRPFRRDEFKAIRR